MNVLQPFVSRQSSLHTSSVVSLIVAMTTVPSSHSFAHNLEQHSIQRGEDLEIKFTSSFDPKLLPCVGGGNPPGPWAADPKLRYPCEGEGDPRPGPWEAYSKL